MKFCANCGKQISDHSTFCPYCGSPCHDDPTPAPPPPPPEPPKSNYVPAEGEVAVKTYHCATVRAPAVEGYLTVTNKRLIFHSNGTGRSFVSKEIKLDEVCGVECLNGTNISVSKIIFASLLLIVSLFSFDWKYVPSLVGFLGLAVSVFLFFRAIKSTYSLCVYSSHCSPSPIDLGRGAQTLVGNSAVLALAANEGRDTQKMIKELGGLVLDLQTLGDAAIAKWADKK